ncbi:hypothetical protein DB346_07015 [Verrucomicrobia bacterium LW23]|nr:hypothetical protein DB346_07015 [Verrucomicrobia bacterium LW23]
MARRAPLLVEDVCELGRRRVDPDLVLRYLRARQTIYPLTTAQVNQLQRSGVAPRVIDYMLTTRDLYALNDPPFNAYFGVGAPYGLAGYYGYPWGYGPMPLHYRGYYRGRHCR